MKPKLQFNLCFRFWPKWLIVNAIFALVPFLGWAQAPIMDDKPAYDSVRKAIDLIYNYQFEKAETTLRHVKARYGNHPGYHLSYCILYFWRFFPIGTRPKEYQVYLKTLHLVARQAEKMQEKNPKSPEPVFYSMMANLLMARHNSEEGEYIKAVGEARNAYAYIKQGFDLKSQYPDFYFSTGLYNYYREAFPENHPLYKPFTVFFTEGNKSLGIKELEVASVKSVFTRAEALIFLSVIHLRDLYNVPLALKYSTQLHEAFPFNWLFAVIYTECLIESKKYDAAEPFVSKLLMRTETSSLIAGYYLKGLLERKDNRDESARWNFQKALSYAKGKDRVSKGFIGLCYNELAKIAYAEGKREQAKKYFKLALEHCTFRKVKNDAKAAGF